MDNLAIFDNAAARDSLVPHPMIGQMCVLASTGQHQIYYGTKVGWQSDWSVAWGEVARAELTSFYTFATPENLESTPVGTCTFTPVVGRKYNLRWRLTIETGDKGQSFDVGLALVASFGAIPSSFATIGGNYILDGVTFSRSDIKNTYPLNWRRVADVNHDITSLVSAGVSTSITGQYAYGSAVVANLFLTTTDGLYAKDDPGSETSLVVQDVGPAVNLSTVS